MKKIFNIFMIALMGMGGFSSCSDHDTDEPSSGSGSAVTIVSRETSFPAMASQGIVVVNANGPVTVTASDHTGWISTAVSGNEITVSVTQNSALYGRTAMLTISCGSASTELAIYQAGLAFDFDGPTEIDTDDAKLVKKYKMTSNLPLDIKSDVNWIQTDLVEGQLTVTIEANETGHPRQGTISYGCDEFQGSIPVRQYDFDKDIAGVYEMRYTTSTGTIANYPVKLARSGENYTIAFTSITTTTAPVTFDPETLTVTMTNASYFGRYQNKYTYAGAIDENAAIIYDANVTWSFTLGYEFDEAAGMGVLSGAFNPGERLLSGISLVKMNQQRFTASYFSAKVKDLVAPYLYREYPDATSDKVE